MRGVPGLLSDNCSAYLQCQTKCLPKTRLLSAATGREPRDEGLGDVHYWLQEVPEWMPHVAFKVQKHSRRLMRMCALQYVHIHACIGFVLALSYILAQNTI